MNDPLNDPTASARGSFQQKRAEALKIVAKLREARIEMRTATGLKYRIDKEHLSLLPDSAKVALDAVGGVHALVNADDIGLRVLRGQFATVYAEGAA